MCVSVWWKKTVSEESVLRNSDPAVKLYLQVMKQQPYELRRRLYIMFKGEEGLDYGGIARLVGLQFFSCAYRFSLIDTINLVEMMKTDLLIINQKRL